MKPWVAIAILTMAALIVYLVPKPKYQSPQILSKISIPFETETWQSRNISGKLNLKDRRYNFLGSFIARQYASDLGESLLFLVVDAINFHHPRGCFDSSGFLVHSMGDLTLEAGNRKWKAQAYFMEKGRESVVVVYWICIDKKVVNWAEQRVDQIYYSLFGQKKTGFLLRLDIRAKKERVDLALITAKDFIRNIGSKIPPEQADYFFGSSN